MAAIHHHVWINAPVGRVYRAISSAEEISRWWDRQTAVETSAGLVLEHNPGPEHGVVRMRVLQMVADKRVEWECISTHPQTTPAFAWTGTHVTFDIMDRQSFAPAMAAWATGIPAQAILDFRHSGWDEDSDYFGTCNFAWGAVLLNLQRVCEESD